MRPRRDIIRNMLDDLTTLKDDMHAFITGHGLKQFRGFVGEEIQTVMWDWTDAAEEWKDFVELAQAAGAKFLTVNEGTLERQELDDILKRLENSTYVSDDEVDDARWLRTYVGKLGFLQLGFAHQGTIFLYEISTEWYDRYQRLVDTADDLGGIVFDEPDQDDER